MHHSEKAFIKLIEKHRSTILFWIAFVFVFILINTASNAAYDKFIRNKIVQTDNSETPTTSTENESDCSALGINVHGGIMTYIPEGNSDELLANKDVVASEHVVSAIQSALDDDKIKAILIEVDSPGGEPVAGEEIAKALKGSNKPTAAFIRQSGTSAAYWAISSAGKIFASRNSDVGSIGVTASYVENINKDKKFIQLSTGKYKDSGNPDKPLTEDEKALVMRDIKIVHKNFINDVATNRKLAVDAVAKIADGSSVLGDSALKLGLIDEIGGYNEAKSYLESAVGEKLHVCWQ